MADSTIPGKTNRPTLDGNELLPSSYNGSPFNISVTSIKNFVIGFFTNKATVLDKLGVDDGKLTFNGSPVGGAVSSGLSNSVQLSDGTGGFGSSAQCVFDPEFGTLNVVQIVPEEVTAAAPFASGNVTGGTTLTIVDSTKSWAVDELADKVVILTRPGLGTKDVRLIKSNTATTISISGYFLQFSITPTTGDTYKIITPTVLTSLVRNQIVRVNMSNGYDHVVVHPRVDSDNNRNVITTYIEGHDGAAICYGITSPSVSGPSGNQTFNFTGNSFELIADRELVSHTAHDNHYDLLYSTGLQAFGEGTWAPQVITANQSTFTPVDNNLTPFKLRRFEGVTVDGQFWGKYTSQLKRNFMFNIVCDGVLNGLNDSIIEVGLRHYSVETGLTTDYTGVGGNVSVRGIGTTFRFNLVKNLQLSYGDRFQIVHKNNNATNYTITPKLVII